MLLYESVFTLCHRQDGQIQVQDGAVADLVLSVTQNKLLEETPEKKGQEDFDDKKNKAQWIAGHLTFMPAFQVSSCQHFKGSPDKHRVFMALELSTTSTRLLGVHTGGKS